jgi:hypothetical protein
VSGPRPNGALLVGSVPLASAERVISVCAEELGEHLESIPDGETGDRSIWIVYQAYRVFHPHPGLETVQRPPPVDGIEQWAPTGLHDLWDFRVRPGADLHFEDLRYASVAAESYAVFRRLRQDGVIRRGARFQVSLPTPESILFFFRNPGQFAHIVPAYTDALGREVDKVLSAVPAEDLRIQWDVCTEVLDAEGVAEWIPPQTIAPLDRYAAAMAGLAARIPNNVPVGYHLCYADLGHRHVVEPKDLSLVVQMANLTAASIGRDVDYFHLPVPRNRTDDDYFQPLRNLDIGSARVYAGLVHHTDGLPGAIARADAVGRHLAEFGIATECGFGRRSPDQVPELLRLHRRLIERDAG